MRFIKRLPKPDILTRKENVWRDNFLQSNKARPHNSQYAHQEIRSALNSMSFHKCFYCERKLKDISQEVDHFIEVAERKELAFDWNNLYLACDNCNNKINNKAISVDQALDPCRDADDVIQVHLTFDDEIIRAKNNSLLGLNTIKKYRLDNDQLDKVRVVQIKNFQKVLIQIQQNLIYESRQINELEKEALLHFQNVDQSFSLMFRVLLEKYDLF